MPDLENTFFGLITFGNHLEFPVIPTLNNLGEFVFGKFSQRLQKSAFSGVEDSQKEKRLEKTPRKFRRKDCASIEAQVENVRNSVVHQRNIMEQCRSAQVL